MRPRPLSDVELQMNQQAAAVAATVLGQAVEAATRCEQPSTEAIAMYPSGGGEVYSRRVPNGTGLPKSFILAVTRNNVHALEDKQHHSQLVAGKILKSWDRVGLTARLGSNAMAHVSGLPGDRQAITLWLPIDGDSGHIAQAIAQQRAAAGQRIPGLPQTFWVGKDAPSQRVIDALGATTPGQSGSGPSIRIGSGAKITIGRGANITIAGQRLQDIVAQAEPSTADGLQVFE